MAFSVRADEAFSKNLFNPMAVHSAKIRLLLQTHLCRYHQNKLQFFSQKNYFVHKNLLINFNRLRHFSLDIDDNKIYKINLVAYVGY
jgi:hypothetical protein